MSTLEQAVPQPYPDADMVADVARLLRGRLGAGDERELLRLTDEELAAVDAEAAERGFVRLPYLDQVDDSGRLIAVAGGLRSLIVRELVHIAERAAPVETGEREAAPKAGFDPLLELLITARARVDRVVTTQRHTGRDLYTYQYGYGAGQVLLEESVTDGGIHTFRVMTADVATARLTAIVDPPGHASIDTEAVMLSATAAKSGDFGPLAQVVADAVAVTQVMLFRADEGPGHGRLLTVFTAPGGVWCIDVAGPGAGEDMPARSLSPESLHALGRELLLS